MSVRFQPADTGTLLFYFTNVIRIDLPILISFNSMIAFQAHLQNDMHCGEAQMNFCPEFRNILRGTQYSFSTFEKLFVASTCTAISKEKRTFLSEFTVSTRQPFAHLHTFFFLHLTQNQWCVKIKITFSPKNSH